MQFSKMATGMLKNFSSRYFFVLVLGILLAIYSHLIWHDPILKRDDETLLTPLHLVHSFQDFFSYTFSSLNPDLQPVRDVSLMFDVLVLRFFGISIFHFHNVLIWLVTCFWFHKFLLALIPESKSSFYMALAFATHPVYSMSVSWVSARKHLLAFLFLLMVLTFFTRAMQSGFSRNSSIKIFFTYLLSVFSQPIYVLLPIWLFIYLKIKSHSGDTKAGLRLLAGMTLVMTAAVIANYSHYSFFYNAIGEVQEKLESLKLTSINQPGDILLALGRYFFNIVFPYKLANVYSKGSIENLLGLFSLPLAIFLVGKYLTWRPVLLWASFSLLMLALVLLKIRTLFLSDTYVLGASLSCWVILFFSIEKLLQQRPKWGSRLAFFCSILVVVFLWRSSSEARVWVSDFSVWENSYRKEGNCLSSANYGLDLFKQGRTDQAERVVFSHINDGCKEAISEQLFYLGVFYSSLPNLEKIMMIEQFLGSDALLLTKGAILSALYLQSWDVVNANRWIQNLFSRDQFFWRSLHPIEVKPLMESVRVYCAVEGGLTGFQYCDLGTHEISARL